MTVSFITPTQNSKSMAKESCLSRKHPRNVCQVSTSPLTLWGELLEKDRSLQQGSNPELTQGLRRVREEEGGRAAPAKKSQTRNLFKRRLEERRQVQNGVCKRITELEETSEARKTRPREDRQLKQFLLLFSSQRKVCWKMVVETKTFLGENVTPHVLQKPLKVF